MTEHGKYNHRSFSTSQKQSKARASYLTVTKARLGIIGWLAVAWLHSMGLALVASYCWLICRQLAS